MIPMSRRRVTLKDSLNKSMKASNVDGDASLFIIPVAIWYWIVGEPVADDGRTEDRG